ncbi:MAG: 4Fe-4S dicluster domain-containing protein [Candidatus Methanofastidiosia archaeon]|jgi:ferredoxin
MENFVIAKNKMPELVQTLAQAYTVVGPVAKESVIVFDTVDKYSDMVLEYSNTVIPPKNVVFPQTETLFTFSTGETTVTAPDYTGNVVILGVRPCDAKSFAILDHVFEGEYQDPYVKRRENTIVIGLNCITPEDQCFCTSIGDGPFCGKYSDIQLTDLGEKYFIEVMTKKGESLIKKIKKLVNPAADKDVKQKNELEQKALELITRSINIEDIVEKLEELFESDYWRDIAKTCLGCAACTYVCPTCHCFDMQDESTFTKGARIRVWDSCMFPEYTQQASGYNPRPERMNRVRNRVYHKFDYFPKTWDIMGCTGCGRCIAVCPVNIDIVKVVNTAQEVKK